MTETPGLTPDGTPRIRPVEKAGSYSVYSCDGFATSLTKRVDDATFQFSFWLDDITPDNEDLTKPITDVGHFDINLKRVFQTAIKLNPNIAMQLAVNILENLAELPDNIKDRHSIPRTLKAQRGTVP
jgi:hypothetical protein